MKKFAMMTVKGAIGLVPKAVRNKLKGNHKLTEFYSRSLQRSGLFYGFPSEKKRMALYKDYLQYQSKILGSKAVGNEANLAFIYIIFGHKDLAISLKSLREVSNGKMDIRVVTEKTLGMKVSRFPSLAEAVRDLDDNTLLFFLNSGDTITHDTVKVFTNNNDEADLTYCDTDRIDVKKRRVSPHFLPDWNPDLQYSTGYVFTGVKCKAKLLKQNSVKSQTIAGLVAELWLKQPELLIKHLPFTLVHRTTNKAAVDERLKDIRERLSDCTTAVASFNTELGVNHIQWPIASEPLVTLIIPTKNAKKLVQACIDSILEKTTYQNYEILLIDNGSDEKESINYFSELNKHPKIKVLSYPGEFNYSAINNFGVEHASDRCAIIGLINNDIEVIAPNWLSSMVGHASREDIGCVGAKLLYSDGRIQHAGVVMGYGGGAGHAHKYFPRYHPGYIKRLIATQNYSAVTAACLLVKKSLFLEVGGLNEKDLTVAFNDVDFCLKVKETGARNIYCAEAELYHHESVSRGTDHAPEKAARFNRELHYLKTRWGNYIDHDPAYSPNLTLMRENFSVKTKGELSQ
ncbi:glycosyltransferase family 2 protein [Alteromonas gracilis]|uniref:Glycosyl transferase n=1 Tax=Alteromonas gracilis TaxID=1479524 RepID=A0ABX5CQY8_9ALTE|nr:glycosyltransferase [Alteromonas gracilis]PRO69872.1 glycosyl transferase [Alteromonas gracilis]